MLQHQHNILTQIGIDLWVPKHAQVKEYSHQSIWRDTLGFDEALQPEPIVTLPEKKLDIKIEQQETVSRISEQKTPKLETEVGEVQSFSLTAFSYHGSIILASHETLNETETKLLQGITIFCHATPLNLSWPLPFENLQDPDHMGCYLQGFLDQFGLNKRIIILGSVPIKVDQAIYTVSLQEMVENPASKCELWSLLKEKKQQEKLNEEGHCI